MDSKEDERACRYGEALSGWRDALVYLPFYRRLNLTCAYEYLEQRFNVATRLVASVLFIVFQCGRTAIVLYLPALALATVANFDLTACILLMGALCIVYTVAGGIEAVIWTDVAQSLVLMGGAVFGLVIAVMRIDGGLSAVFAEASAQGKFFETLDWNWDLAAGTAWTVILGSVFHNLFAYSASQDVVQRYFTTPDQTSAARAIRLSARPFAIAPSVFIEQGATTMPAVANDPLATDAPMSLTLWTTWASASTSPRFMSSSWWTFSTPADESSRWVSMPGASRSRRSSCTP